jgi:hypothetical protein
MHVSFDLSVAPGLRESCMHDELVTSKMPSQVNQRPGLGCPPQGPCLWRLSGCSLEARCIGGRSRYAMLFLLLFGLWRGQVRQGITQASQHHDESAAAEPGFRVVEL